ncbi:MAG: MBL fold metallo-hydrolase [Chlamydiales bacterium]
MEGEFLFLGTGGSAGVPVIGCHCPVCLSKSSCNKRLRSSALIRAGGKNFLIDVGPDFRMQALTHKIERLDGVLLTHTHFDHIGGIDDLRVFYFLQKAKLPCLLSQETYDEVKICYHYLMQPLKDGHTICAQLDFFILNGDFGAVNFGDFNWKYVSYHQSQMKVTGYLLGNLAYISDIRVYPERLVPALKGVEILILSTLKTDPTQMHFGLDEAIHFSKAVGAKKTFLTHLSHDFDHEAMREKLPPNIQLGYDGLKIPFTL